MNLVELDVADDDSVRNGLTRVLAATGRIDVLINNPEIGGNGTVEETPIDTYAFVMNVDLYGQLRCLRAVQPSMRQRRSGVIVNITSVAGRVAALAPSIIRGVEMSEQIAQEVVGFGIRISHQECHLRQECRLDGTG